MSEDAGKSDTGDNLSDDLYHDVPTTPSRRRSNATTLNTTPSGRDTRPTPQSAKDRTLALVTRLHQPNAAVPGNPGSTPQPSGVISCMITGESGEWGCVEHAHLVAQAAKPAEVS